MTASQPFANAVAMTAEGRSTFGILHMRLDQRVVRDRRRSDLVDARQRLVGKFGHPSEPVLAYCS
jgi:hypothetical protein